MEKLKSSSFLAIDPDDLASEWVEHPRLVFQYNQKLANAKLCLDEARNLLKAVEAELDEAIRKNPSKYGIEKPTDKAIAALIPNMSKFKKAQQAMLEQGHSVGVLQAACTALEHRKNALKDLVTLHTQSYYAEPSTKGMTSEHFETARKKKIRRGQ